MKNIILMPLGKILGYIDDYRNRELNKSLSMSLKQIDSEEYLESDKKLTHQLHDIISKIIGYNPNPNRVKKNLYSHEEVMSGIREKRDYNKKHPIKAFIANSPYKINQFIWRRIESPVRDFYDSHTQGFPSREAWSYCSYAAQWSIPRLKELRNQSHGYPTSLYSLIDKNHWDDITEEESTLLCNEWQNILNKIIRAFELSLEDGDVNLYLDDQLMAEFKEGMRLYGEYFLNLWD